MIQLQNPGNDDTGCNSAFRRFLSFAAAAVLTLSTASALRAEETGFSWMLPKDVSTYGHHVDGLYSYLCYVTGTAFALVMITVLYFCVRYRSGGAKAFYTRGDSWTATGLTCGLAITVFLAMDMNTVRMSNAAAKEIQTIPDDKNAIRVQVQAQQFAWRIRYPGPDGKFGANDMKTANDENLFGIKPDALKAEGKDDVSVEGVMCIPVNTPIIIEIRSKDVIHSFFLPHFRIKQDAVPGMKNTIWIQCTKEGEYEIACAELCGFMHSQMGGRLQVVSAEKYQAWLKDHAP